MGARLRQAQSLPRQMLLFQLRGKTCAAPSYVHGCVVIGIVKPVQLWIEALPPQTEAFAFMPHWMGSAFAARGGGGWWTLRPPALVLGHVVWLPFDKSSRRTSGRRSASGTGKPKW